MEPSPILFDAVATGRHRLRMAVVTETFPPEVNGVAMTTGRIVSAMQARGHQIQLIRPRQGALDTGLAEPNLEHVLKPGIPIPRYHDLRLGLPAKSSLLKLWRVKRPDVVHLVTEGPLGWSALSAALLMNVPVTSDFHTNFHHYSRHYGLGWFKAPIEKYLRHFHNRTRMTMVPTQAMRDELQQDGYQHLNVVARGVDTQLFTPARRSDSLRAVTFSLVAIAYFPWLAPVLLPLTLLVALSRIVLGLHYPTDVLAGAALGYGLAMLSFRF